MSVENIDRKKLWQITENTFTALKNHESNLFSAIDNVKIYNNNAYIIDNITPTLVSSSPLEILIDKQYENLTEYLTFSGINNITGQWNFNTVPTTSANIITNYQLTNKLYVDTLTSAVSAGGAFMLNNLYGVVTLSAGDNTGLYIDTFNKIITLSATPPDLTNYIKADGTKQLTADWNVGAYNISANTIFGTTVLCNNLTSDGVISAIAAGGNAFYYPGVLSNTTAGNAAQVGSLYLNDGDTASNTGFTVGKSSASLAGSWADAGFVWNWANAALMFGTNGTERGGIDATGYLCIDRGLHVGCKLGAVGADPGNDNLLVDGTATITGAFGCNGAAAQTTYTIGTSATDADTTMTLANLMRLALINIGIGKTS